MGAAACAAARGIDACGQQQGGGQGGFLMKQERVLLVDDEPESLLEQIETYEPPVIEKWLDRDQI